MSTAVALQPSSHYAPLAPQEQEHRLLDSSPSVKTSSGARRPHMTSSSPPRPVLVASRSADGDDRSVSLHGQPSPPSGEKRSPANGGRNSQSKQPNASDADGPIIKKERPASPEPPPPTSTSTRRSRPGRLDLSNNMSVAQATRTARPSAPLTAKESAGLVLQDVGLACLSPGFQTHDPSMQQQLGRALDVREQQRQLIEARMNKNPKEGSAKKPADAAPMTSTFQRPLATSKRKGPPPGLSITAPSAQQFANEPRVIQSAPLNQSFTGLRPGPQGAHPLSRQVLEQSHQNQHQHQDAPPQSATRLPPIHDMVSGENFQHSSPRPSRPDTLSRHDSNGSLHAPLSARLPLPSPGFPSHSHASVSQQHLPVPQLPRDREYRSAEEAMHTLAGGREDLMPKIVHYGGAQPPTPPSPLPAGHTQQYAHQQQHIHSQSAAPQHYSHASFKAEADGVHASSGRRRPREEYERDDPDSMDVDEREERDRERRRAGPFSGFAEGVFGARRGGRDDPETERRKKDEFLSLCARAWDLLHS